MREEIRKKGGVMEGGEYEIDICGTKARIRCRNKTLGPTRGGPLSPKAKVTKHPGVRGSILDHSAKWNFSARGLAHRRRCPPPELIRKR